MLHHAFMTSRELKRWLTRQDCTFGTQTGSHLKVYRGDKSTILPMHGKKKDLGYGLVNSIKKDPGLQ
jgi:mRNA interferase HicA